MYSWRIGEESNNFLNGNNDLDSAIHLKKTSLFYRGSYIIVWSYPYSKAETFVIYYGQHYTITDPPLK